MPFVLSAPAEDVTKLWLSGLRDRTTMLAPLGLRDMMYEAASLYVSQVSHMTIY